MTARMPNPFDTGAQYEPTPFDLCEPEPRFVLDVEAFMNALAEPAWLTAQRARYAAASVARSPISET